MTKEVISNKLGISLIGMFLVGSTSVFVLGVDAKNDLWLAIILAIFIALPLALICARLQYMFPGYDLFDIIQTCFNNIFGNIICILYIWYFFHQVSDISRTFSHFVNTATLRYTPLIIIMSSFLFVCAWSVKKGIEVIGRCTQFFLIIYIVLLLSTVLLLIPHMNINNIRPVLSSGIGPVIKAAFLSFTFPFGEIVIFTMIFSTLKEKTSSYKVYILGLLLGGTLILLSSLSSIFVIGVDEISRVYYPSYNRATRIVIGQYLHNIEAIVAITYSFSVFTKISIYLISTCKGITKIFKSSDYRFIVIPVSLLSINLFYILYDSMMAFVEWDLEVWPYYAFPFQVFLPIVIWIFAEIKRQRLPNK